MSVLQEVKGHTQQLLTISTTVDSSSVLPPPDPLSRHTPLSGRNAAGTTQLQGGRVVVTQAGMHTHTPLPFTYSHGSRILRSYDGTPG